MPVRRMRPLADISVRVRIRCRLADQGILPSQPLGGSAGTVPVPVRFRCVCPFSGGGYPNPGMPAMRSLAPWYSLSLSASVLSVLRRRLRYRIFRRTSGRDSFRPVLPCLGTCLRTCSSQSCRLLLQHRLLLLRDRRSTLLWSEQQSRHRASVAGTGKETLMCYR